MPLRILILSDMHAFRPVNAELSTDDVSFLRVTAAPTPGYPDPIDRIADAIEREGLEVDWIVCPGDLADKADPDAQAFVWKKLEDLKSKVGARCLIATAGNHDIDSRLKFNEFDAKGALQGLVPPFPGLDEVECDKYWSRNFHIYQEENALVVNLNSAAFHGFSSETKGALPEYRHGRVSQRTIDAIKSRISGIDAHLNILLTHHHPEKDESIYDNDYSEMQLGSKLLQELQDATRKNWLVIHGHQHFPRLTYGRGATFRPVIFSAGSLSANLVGDQARRAVNQFYLLTAETSAVSLDAHGPCGTVRAWHWAGRSSWEPSPSVHKIPDQCGFGYHATVQSIAHRVKEVIERQGSAWINYLDICSEFPELRYILKETFDQLEYELGKIGVTITKAERYIDSLFRMRAPEAAR